jgi:hypothetical protein
MTKIERKILSNRPYLPHKFEVLSSKKEPLFHTQNNLEIEYIIGGYIPYNKEFGWRKIPHFSWSTYG